MRLALWAFNAAVWLHFALQEGFSPSGVFFGIVGAVFALAIIGEFVPTRQEVDNG